MLPFVTHRFRFPYDAITAARKLSQQLQKAECQSITGEVSADRVELKRASPNLRRNGFDLVFVGRFETHGKNAILTGRFRFHWFTIVFMLVLYGVLGYQLLDAFFQPDQPAGRLPGWRREELANLAQFICLAIFFPLFGWLIGLPSQSAIARAIEESSRPEKS